MVTSAQLRAARSLLNWTVRDLAEKSGVHRNTITRAETDQTTHGHAVVQVVRTLEAAGVEFTNGGQPGVRLMKGIVPVPDTGEIRTQTGVDRYMLDRDVVRVMIENGSTSTPLLKLGADENSEMGDPSDRGAPQRYQIIGRELRLWPTPDKDYVLVLLEEPQ